MKLKLINVFAVCLITLTVLFPSLAVFGLVWEKHLNFVEQQHIPSYNQSIESECSAFQIQTNFRTNNHVNLNLSNNYQIRHLWRWFFFLYTILYGSCNLFV